MELSEKIKKDLLNSNYSASQIAERYNMTLSEVYELKKKLKKEKVDDDLDSLLKVSPEVLEETKKEIEKKQSNLPTELKKLQVLKGVEGLQRLNDKNIQVANIILSRVESVLLQDEEINTLSLKNLKIATEIITSINSAFFGKNVTNITVNNQTNNILNTDKQIFKSKLGV